MKTLKRRLMTGLLAIAMMFSSMPGMGMLVANAAVDAQVNTVTAKVVDSNGQPVQGVTMSLYDTGLKFEYKKPVTDAEGKASYTFGSYDDSSYVLRVKSGQSVVCDTEYSIVVENGGYISTINGTAVTEAKDLEFVVKENDSAPQITSIEAPASMAKDTTSVDVKIVGKNLPESFRCRLQAKYDDGQGGFATNGNFAEVTAKEGGSASERTVTLAAPYCANPVSWEVTVQIPEYSITKTAEIAVASEPSEPDQPSVDSKVLNVVVKDGDNNPVEGLELSLTNGTGVWSYTKSIGKTDAEGKLSVDVSADTKLVEAFDLVLADSSKYTLSSSPEIYFDVDDDFKTVVSTVDDEDYNGLVELTVEKNPSTEEPSSQINTVTAKVIDSNGQPVQGVTMSLYDTGLKFEYKKPVTDAEGKASYTFGSYDDSSYVLRVKSGQSVVCDTEYSIVVENGGYISTINGTAVTEAKDLEFVVKENDSAPQITSIEAPASMAKDTTSVDVKIVGKNLPESFRCRLQAKYDDGQGGFATNGNFAEVTAKEGGSASERTVTLAAPYCANPVSWEVTVQIPEYSITKTATIDVASVEPPTPEEPNIDSVAVNVTTAERKDQEVTVTVIGTALPEELHYDIWSKTSANVENPAVKDTTVTAEGTSTERTFTITLPDADKFDDVKFWRVRVAIDPEVGYNVADIAVKEHVHDYVTVPGKAATCTESGLTEGSKCKDCGEVAVEQTVIDALGHHVVTDPAKAATYFATGLTAGKHCDRCGVVTVKRKTVAKLKLGQAKAPKLKAGKRYIKVSYQAVKGANAYQIRYHKKGTKLTKTITVKGSKAATKKLSKLSKKRWYNIKVRAIRTVNGRTAYGSWSAARNAKVK